MDLFMVLFPILVGIPVALVMWLSRPWKPIPPRERVAVGFDPGMTDGAAGMVVVTRDSAGRFVVVGDAARRVSQSIAALGAVLKSQDPGKPDPFQSPYSPSNKQKGQQ